MGKFDGVLLASDYDATFAIGFDVPPANLEMVEYFKAQGGKFTISTGRALHTFGIVRHCVPLHIPAILANGAMIYDYDKEEVLFERPLPDIAREDMSLLARLRPEMSLEVYRGADNLYVWNTNEHVKAHLDYVKRTPAGVGPIETFPLPWDKAILEHDHHILESLQTEILSRWGDRYEAFFSADTMLELNAKGCTKGAGVLRLAGMLGIEREHIYCVGDNQNDISMLEISAIPFAPEDAIPMVKALPGIQILPPCEEGAVAALIRRLDAIY